MNIHTPITEIKIYHVFNFPMCSTPWYFSNLFCSVFFFLKFWSWPASQPTTESPPAVWTALSHSEERQGQDSNQVITALGPDLLAERMSGKTETLEAWGQVRTLPMRGAAVQSLSCVRLCDPKDSAHQPPLSSTISRSLLKLISIEGSRVLDNLPTLHSSKRESNTKVTDNAFGMQPCWRR